MAIGDPSEPPHFIEQVEDILVFQQRDAPLDEIVPVEDEVARGRSAAEERENVGVPAIGEAIREQLRSSFGLDEIVL